MKKETRKQRFSLALLFGTITFCILLVSLLVAAVIVFVLSGLGITADASGFDATQTVILMAAVSLVVGVGLTLLSVKVPLEPLNRVVTQLNRLASGDYKARLSFEKPLGAHPGFAQMSESFNKLACELENTELLRSDFINNFSHEFKTPIVSISGFAKLLRRGDLTEADRREYLQIIEQESMRLSALATNVLNLTKVENQAILTNVTAFNLSEQLRACVLLLENKWTEKQLELQLDFGEHTVCADEELLMEVWLNLLDNAVKFSPAGHTVQVCIREQGQRLQVDIRNTGSQIPPEKQERIWNKFYQGDESHAAQGNGVGLAIVRRVVQLHQGSVSVTSANEVTTFTVELPKTQ